MLSKFEGNKSPFQVKDCAFTSIATGHMARTLIEFHELLKIIPLESIYHHFWRQTVDTSFAEGSYYNDFSHWAHYDLHDDFLAERLTWINPTEYTDLEKLRVDMLQITKKRIIEQDQAAISTMALPFYFVKSNIVIFNTDYKIDTPKDLVTILPNLSKSSIFYHFIDARRRQLSKDDDFTVWLEEYEGLMPLIQRLRAIDPYFISLFDLQKKLIATVTEYFL
jgi:hypothetical protein